MSESRPTDDLAIADTVIRAPRATTSRPGAIEPDLLDTIVPGRTPTEAAVTEAEAEPTNTDPTNTDPTPAPPPAARSMPRQAQAPNAPARQGHYAFRVGSESEVITLDAPSYVGRRPSPPRIPNAVAPRLISVASPRREVSATHLEITQVGGSVVVRDLATTNGSIVHLPGSVPRTLRQGESVVVSPGTLVDIGDDNVIHILPVQGTS